MKNTSDHPNLLFSSSASIISILATSEAYKIFKKEFLKYLRKSNKNYLDICRQRSNLLELRVVPSQKRLTIRSLFFRMIIFIDPSKTDVLSIENMG